MKRRDQRPEPANLSGVAGFSEDFLGFGRTELRTCRHAAIRPARMLDAYMVQGPTGDGAYTRPQRLYLVLNGFLMFALFLGGGTDTLLADMPSDLLLPLVERSGKSFHAFMADADSWVTFVMVPLGASLLAVATAPLIRLWDPDDLGWRRGFRATFAFLNTWTIYAFPLALLSYQDRWLMIATVPGMIFTAWVAFLLTGRGRWWTSPVGGVIKGLVLAVWLQLLAIVSSVLVLLIGLLGATFGP